MKTLQVIMLAGSVRPSALRRAVDRPIASLPLDSGGTTLFDAWMSALATLHAPIDVIIAVNQPHDVPVFEQLAAAHARRSAAADSANVTSPSIRVILDPRDWRGSAGLLHDLRPHFAADSMAGAVVIEAACLPPTSLVDLLEPVHRSMGAIAIGATDEDEPAGAYALRVDVLDQVPDVGYFDLKEQLVPRLTEQGLAVIAVSLEGATIRLQTPDSYLQAVRVWAERIAGAGQLNADSRPPMTTSPLPGVRLFGRCVIEAGASVEPGAVLHDAVVLRGARVASGAVVSRCLVGETGALRAESHPMRTRPFAEVGSVPANRRTSGRPRAPRREVVVRS